MDPILILDILGTIAFALSGYILASRANLDLLGIMVITFISSFGGGVVRDLLIDRAPFIFHETYPLTLVFIVFLIAWFLKLHDNKTLENNNIFILSDSIGLSLFAFTGATLAISAGFNFGGILFLAFITSVGGGVIRDMILNKVPYVLTSEIYGTVSLTIGAMVWVCNYFGYLNDYAMAGIIIFGVIFRLLAIKKNMRLPKLV